MCSDSGATAQVETTVTVRYWAAARDATGVAQDTFAFTAAITLADVVRRVLAVHPSPRVAQVLDVCSILVGDQPVGTREPGQVSVPAGSAIEFLPPFAGG